MTLKKNILGILVLFSILPLGIFGVFSLYEMNQKIEAMVMSNLEAISKNQIAAIHDFTGDRKSEMEKVASYTLVRDAVKNSLGQSDIHVDRVYLDNLLKEQKKYGTFVASVSIIDRDFKVVGSSEQYEVSEISQLKDVQSAFHSGEFVIGDVYERRTDDGLKRVVPAFQRSLIRHILTSCV